MPHKPDLNRTFWDKRTRDTGDAQPLYVYGTVTEHVASVHLRDALERAHVADVVPFRRTDRVLDLGGGAGRFALWLSDRVHSITLVDHSEELLRVARRESERRGVENIEFHHASVLTWDSKKTFDVVMVMGVLTHLDDTELQLFFQRIGRFVAPNGLLVVKEPVTTDGETRSDVRPGYLATFRPREQYANMLSRDFVKTYQSATCAHLLPWWVGGTNEAAAQADGRLGPLVMRATPLLVGADPIMRRVERMTRSSPLTSWALSPVPVVQDLFMFAAVTPPIASELLSVIVIAFNEQECLKPVVEELSDALQCSKINHEIIVVDDGSTDNTAAVIQALVEAHGGVRDVRLPRNGGIGAALKAGFDAARGDFITWIPADGQIGSDVVVDLHRRRTAASMITTVYTARDDHWLRTLVSTTLNGIIRVTSQEPAKSGGNYLFRRKAWETYGPKDDDTMMISSAFRRNLRDAGEAIIEHPIAALARRGGHSKVTNPKTIARTLIAALRMTGRT